jgi:hypothetical protein
MPLLALAGAINPTFFKNNGHAIFALSLNTFYISLMGDQ